LADVGSGRGRDYCGELQVGHLGLDLGGHFRADGSRVGEDFERVWGYA